MPSLDTLNALCNEQGEEIKALERDAIRRQRDHRVVIDARDAELLVVRNELQALKDAHSRQGITLDRVVSERDTQRQLADQHARQRDEAMTQRDEARELLEVAKAQVTDLAARMGDVEKQRDELRRQVADLRIALDDTGRPATSLESRVARLEAIHRARELARADFRARMRP